MDASDVLRCIMQFLRENNLPAAARALQDETSVPLNVVEDVDAVVADVVAGKWDAVLSAVSSLKLPPPLLSSIYEQVVKELIEARELETAKAVRTVLVEVVAGK